MNPELRALIIEDDPDVRLGCEQAMMLADAALLRPGEGAGFVAEEFAVEQAVGQAAAIEGHQRAALAR